LAFWLSWLQKFNSGIWQGPPTTTLEADGLWHWSRTGLVCPPDLSNIRFRLFEAAHRGHGSFKATIHELTRKVFWPGMTQQVAGWISKCNPCKVSFKDVQELLIKPEPGVAMAGTEPNDVVAADWFKFYNHYVLIFVDTKTFFMDWIGPYYYEGAGQPTAADSAYGLSCWSARHGPMKLLVTDNGPHFDAKDFRAKAESLGITHRMTTSPYNPQANGYAERAGRSAKEKARAMLIDRGLTESDVDDIYGDIFLALNSQKFKENSDIPPLEAWNLRPVATTLDRSFEDDRSVLYTERLEPMDEKLLHKWRVMNSLDRDRFNTRRQMLKARKRQHIEQLQQKPASEMVIRPRCFVLVKDPGKAFGTGISPLYRGPWLVASDFGNGDYLLQSLVDVKRTKRVHSRELKWFANPMNGPTKEMRELAALTNTFLYEPERIENLEVRNGEYWLLVSWRHYDETTWEPLQQLWFDQKAFVEQYVERLGGALAKHKGPIRKAITTWTGEAEEEGGSVV